MNKNACYLKLYLNNNLGDDLFAKIISEKYPNQEFIMTSYTGVKSNFNNIKVITGFWFRAINKFLKTFTNTTIEKIIASKLEKGLLIGGSMFIEGKSGIYEEFNLLNKYEIIGSNFGPYKTEKYILDCKKLMEKADYVCFRDTKSYNLFKYLGENINIAPDIVFGLDTSKIKITNNKKVVISVIDCKRKLDEKYQEIYEKKIVELAKYFAGNNYEVVFMSFCEKENDEKAIERIFEKIEDKEKITKYYYKGNIEEALNVLGDSSIIVGSRFHANILGLVLNKTIIPVIYSDKTVNALNDINFKGKIIDIRNIGEFKVDTLKEEDFNYKLDVTNEVKKSKIQFKELSKLFN